MKLKVLKKDYRFRLPVSIYNQIFQDTPNKSKLLADILDNHIKDKEHNSQ